jgi:hypothetical protein
MSDTLQREWLRARLVEQPDLTLRALLAELNKRRVMIMLVHTRDIGKERADPSPHARPGSFAGSPLHHFQASKHLNTDPPTGLLACA